MLQKSFFQNNSYQRFPHLGQLLRKLSSKLDHIFGRIYLWSYNPFASSGTIATALLMILIVTGLYLIFFYRLGAPYESVAQIQQQIWFGRWVRSVHRYATDLGLILIVFHMFRMFTHGKTWGPRALAWISGLVMLGMFVLSAFTGFILVWDQFGLVMAKSWAKLVDTLPLLPNPLSRAFSGDVSVGTSFFFMNLFLHVAIPLGLIAALWIHTSKLNSPKWFPPKKVFIVLALLMVMMGVLYPALLNHQADLLEVKGQIIEDYWFSWWLTIQNRVGNSVTLMFFAAIGVLAFAAPLYYRPKKSEMPGPSIHDEEKCEGCRQCYTDCPYEAISMVPRTKGTGSEFVANVNALDCTSCGICSGSCSQFAIGPASRTGRDQLVSLKSLVKSEQLPILFCTNRGSEIQFKNDQLPMPVDCLGSIHPGVITSLLNSHEKIMLAPCAPDCCEMRVGSQIEWARLFEHREPGLPDRVNSSRILWMQEKPAVNWKNVLGALVCTTAFLFVVATLSNLKRGGVGSESFLRLSWRFPIQRYQVCKDLSQEELNKRPVHMRVKQECETHLIPYLISVTVDSVEVLKKKVVAPGMKSDRPLLVDEELPLLDGLHDVKVKFIPDLDDAMKYMGENSPKLEYQFNSQFLSGKAKLLTLSPNQSMFIIREQ